MKASKFVREWNKTHGGAGVSFALCKIPETKRVASVEVRYRIPLNCPDIHEKWHLLNDVVGLKSHGIMKVATTEKMFRAGIIEMKVSSQSYKYRDTFIIDTLAWIGEGLFPGN